jgi:glycosyltransferase involved in cell wall biosynthesis
MKITIVTGPWYPPPPGPAGAVERVWGDLAHRFAGKGHEVRVLCRAWEKQRGDEVVDGVRYRRRTMLSQGKNIYFDLLKDLYFSLRMLALLPDADILVTNAFWLPVIARRLRPGAGRIVMNIQRVPKGQFWLYAGIDRLSAVSRAIRDAIVKERPALEPRVRVIPNPIAAEVFTPPATPRDYAPGSGRTIVFTGRVHPEKGLHVLVDAFKRLHATRPDLRLRVIGPWRVEKGGGGEEYVATLKTSAAGLPVVFDEPIYERARLAAALQEASYYCYPSLAEQGEAQPVAPMEAMATGLPIVVSDIPQFRDYLEPGVQGEVFDHRSGDLAANLAGSLARIIDDPSRARAMSVAAHASAQRFGYNQVADAYLADFDELLRGHRA